MRSKLKSNCGGLGFCALSAVENMCLTLLQKRPRNEGKNCKTKRYKLEGEGGGDVGGGLYFLNYCQKFYRIKKRQSKKHERRHEMNAFEAFRSVEYSI